MNTLLNTQKFETLVKFYKLEDYLIYYKLYNKSKYINSYHGYEHSKKIICSLYELTKDYEYSYSEIRTLMISAIFHDFNYIGVDKNNKNYDEINVRNSEKEYCRYCNFKNEVLSLGISKIILDSEYPKCMNIELDEISKVFITCDHSMIIHEGYNYVGLMFSLNEYGCTSPDEIVDGAHQYMNKVHFMFDKFQNIWETNKDNIRLGFENYIEYIFKTSSLSTLSFEAIKDTLNKPNPYAAALKFEFI